MLDELEDASERLEDESDGYAAAPQRRLLGRTRADLFRIQEAQAAMHRLCTPDEQLSQELSKDLHRRLRRRLHRKHRRTLLARQVWEAS